MTLFRLRCNDITNAFKCYRREVIEGMEPFLSPHFNLTVEMPLKAIVRGYSYTVIPIGWINRKGGISKLKIKEMGSRYLFIVLYIWLEKQFSRGDYPPPVRAPRGQDLGRPRVMAERILITGALPDSSDREPLSGAQEKRSRRRGHRVRQSPPPRIGAQSPAPSRRRSRISAWRRSIAGGSRRRGPAGPDRGMLGRALRASGLRGSRDYLMETNLTGCYHCLELARRAKADFLFLSTSRVYPYRRINQLEFFEDETRFRLGDRQSIRGASAAGVAEDFPLEGPRSLYGMTKLASELMVEEYADAYGSAVRRQSLRSAQRPGTDGQDGSGSHRALDGPPLFSPAAELHRLWRRWQAGAGFPAHRRSVRSRG